MYRLLTGKQRSLVFPVMCNAFVKIDYSDNIPRGVDDAFTTDDDVRYGIWNHKDSFTIEATLTPYDINGYGLTTSVPSTTNSKKMMAGISKTILDSSSDREQRTSYRYLNDTNKYGTASNLNGYEMRIFHSEEVKLSLLNASEHGFNNPSEYRIKFEVDIDGTNVSLTSPVVISPIFGKPQKGSVVLEGFDSEGKVKYQSATSAGITGNALTTIEFDANVESDFHDEQKIYARDGFDFTEIGIVNSVSGSVVTLKSNANVASGSLIGEKIFIPTTKNPFYVNQVHHIAATFNDLTRQMRIYYGGKLVASTDHSSTAEFSFSQEDMFLGANGVGATGRDTSHTNNQFMGEMHEFAFTNGARETFDLASLNPRFAELLLYFRFEEVDE